MKRDYKLHIIDAAAVSVGVAHQAKGALYRFKPDLDDAKDFGGKNADYRFSTSKGWEMPSDPHGGTLVSLAEEKTEQSGDYWLGRNTLTDLVITVPDKGLLVINDAIVNVSKQKEIVKTVLVGRKGTVKEYICDGDYQISITVGLVATDAGNQQIDQYPEKALGVLREVLDLDRALTVSSAFLDLFDVHKMVVTGFSAKQATHSNRQGVEITAVSDTDYIIQSTDY